MAEQAISPKNKKMIESSGPVGQNATVGSRIFDVLNYLIVTLIAITTIIPFVYIIGASFATEYEIATRPMFFIPQDVSIAAYQYIFSSNKILRGFANSIFITAAGTAINLFFTVTMAYAISKPRLRGRNFFLNMVIFSMFFSGGMIPGYIVVANILNLKNTFWSVLLPGAISAYNMMIVKNFFQGIPQELEESASIDGCTDIGVLLKIVRPVLRRGPLERLLQRHDLHDRRQGKMAPAGAAARADHHEQRHRWRHGQHGGRLCPAP